MHITKEKELHPYCEEALNMLELHSKSIPNTNYDQMKVTLSNVEALLLLGRTSSLSDFVTLLGGGSEVQLPAFLLYRCCQEKANQHKNEDMIDDEKGDLNKATKGQLKHGNNCYQLAYETDKDGKCINGSLDQLIKNILDGNDVRVVLNPHQATPGAWNPEKISIHNKVVYATNNTEISINRNGTNVMFQSNAYHYYVCINSNGDRDRIRFGCSDGNPRAHNQNKVAIRWFTRK